MHQHLKMLHLRTIVTQPCVVSKQAGGNFMHMSMNIPKVLSDNFPQGDAMVLGAITSFQIFMPGTSFQPAH